MADRAFNDRTVVITGASAGIGLACARKFAEAGANVVLVARGAAELERARAEVAQLGPALAIAVDVAAPDGPARIVDGALARFGALHVLVNNAGKHARGPFADQTDADLAAMIDVNLRAPILLTRRALPHLLASGRAAVINIASLAGKVPTAGSVVYSATKFGLRGFSMALADELRGSGVTVSCVSPGPVDTQFIMAELDSVTDLTMSQPLVTADQVAALVVASAIDGRLERDTPRLSGALATMGYIAPSLRHALRPMLERRGRRNKQKLRERRAG
ncbi:MAG: SDR family NAD(P)-dependent oxidoreductase [Deltaproteobacteria bacterium]|nr:MAG: SDR family NAD(P)-dependent oxidoreductase [Deltaproteobacteria bacterium]